MIGSNARSTRRFFLHRLGVLGAAPTLASGIGSLGLSGLAGIAAPESASAAGAKGAIWSREYWSQRGDIKLYLYRKRATAPKPGEKPMPVLFLVHGSSISSRPSFDLTVPGHGDYSLMDQFARYGYDVWTMDFEGYGRSSPSAGNSNIADGVEDLKAAVPLVLKETGAEHIHFFGESSGALRAGAYATVEPERVGRLVLGAFTYTGEGSPTLTDRAKQLEFYKTHNRRPRDLAMIRSIFTRDKVGTADPAVGDAMAAVELPMGDSVPTGTYLDMTANLPVVDPLKVKAPVLMIRGEYDGIATEQDLFNFFHQLPNGDRQLVILPGMAHSITLGINRHEFWYVMKNFLAMPQRIEMKS